MKFCKELSTPWHSKQHRWQMAGLRTILKNLCVPQEQVLHIERVWRQSVEKPWNYAHAKKSADRRTAFRLYIVDFRLLFTKLGNLYHMLINIWMNNNIMNRIYES